MTVEKLRDWIAVYEEQEFVVAHKAALRKMHIDLLSPDGSHQLAPIDYSSQIPAGLTKETYLQIYEQVWATLRHDFYKDLRKTVEDTNQGQPATEMQFSDVYE